MAVPSSAVASSHGAGHPESSSTGQLQSGVRMSRSERAHDRAWRMLHKEQDMVDAAKQSLMGLVRSDTMCTPCNRPPPSAQRSRASVARNFTHDARIQIRQDVEVLTRRRTLSMSTPVRPSSAHRFRHKYLPRPEESEESVWASPFPRVPQPDTAEAREARGIAELLRVGSLLSTDAMGAKKEADALAADVYALSGGRFARADYVHEEVVWKVAPYSPSSSEGSSALEEPEHRDADGHREAAHGAQPSCSAWLLCLRRCWRGVLKARCSCCSFSCSCCTSEGAQKDDLSQKPSLDLRRSTSDHMQYGLVRQTRSSTRAPRDPEEKARYLAKFYRSFGELQRLEGESQERAKRNLMV
jgi:hypothetical protein